MTKLRLLALLIIVFASVLALMVLHCASVPNMSGAKFTKIKVYFGTDRDTAATTDLGKRMGTERSDVKYGHCFVSIPRDHRMGELESPKWYKLEFREDPEKHVVVMEINLRTKQDFFSEINAEYPDSNKNALIFIHGYNTPFINAARQTAQITYDLAFKGIPAFYSWPSLGTPLGYPADGENIAWSTPNMVQFFVDFIRETKVKNVVVIAHSMGNRGVVEALSRMKQHFPDERKIIKEVILAAPDIDAEIFKNDIAPRIVGDAGLITLYASSKDLAIKASKQFNNHQRLGDSSPKITVCSGIESIDASNVETGFLGHSYFSDNRSIISDMFYLINDGKTADKRFGLVPMDNSSYWKFKKECIF
jgi:esterase/lipase superfamily enzyme